MFGQLEHDTKKGQRVSYKNVPYSVILDVTAEETKTPDISEKLYENLLKKKQEIKPWNDKTTYSKGDLVIARGIVLYPTSTITREMSQVLALLGIITKIKYCY